MKKLKATIRVAPGHGVEWHARARERRIREGDCVRCGIQPARKGLRECQACSDYQVQKMKDRRHAIRNDVMDLLGGECVDCQIKDRRVLTVDHLDGNGKSHQRQYFKGNTRDPAHKWRAYLRAVKGGMRLALRCFNCHAIKDLWRPE